MKELMELNDTELDMVSGGATAASAAGATAQTASGNALGVAVVVVGAITFIIRGSVTSDGSSVLGPAGNGSTAAAT